jgi:AcrR family transcriptional regulator
MDMAARKRRKMPVVHRRLPVQERSRATVDAILEASARILRKDGLNGLNTNRVADIAGVSVGTLYGYFPDKSAILVALARRIFAQDDIKLKAALEEGGARPVRALVRTLLACHANERALRRIVMSQHIGMGFGFEHGERTQAGVKQISDHTAKHGVSGRDPLRFFIVTRAVLGVCRCLVEEPEDTLPPMQDIEDQLVRMVELYL